MLVFLYSLIIILFILMILFSLFIMILYFSYLKMEIKPIIIEIENNQNKIYYKFKIYLMFLNKLKYLKISLDSEKIKKMKPFYSKSFLYKLFKKKILKNDNIFETLKFIKNKTNNIKVKIEKFNLKVDLGIQNVVLLSNIIAFLDIIISSFLARNILNQKLIKKQKDLKRLYSYDIKPNQTDKIVLNLYFNCIISLKISNIFKKTCNLKKIKV